MVELLIDQIEFSNVIIMNKMDLITEDEALRLESILKQLNTEAKILKSINANVILSFPKPAFCPRNNISFSD